jgi:ATP-dependent RNA helicase DHX8/PRP22
MIMPVYAALPFESQCEIFRQALDGVRKVIVATNIAETSLTIDGIHYVVDTGYFKESIYDRGIDTLKVRNVDELYLYYDDLSKVVFESWATFWAPWQFIAGQ